MSPDQSASGGDDGPLGASGGNSRSPATPAGLDDSATASTDNDRSGPADGTLTAPVGNGRPPAGPADGKLRATSAGHDGPTAAPPDKGRPGALADDGRPTATTAGHVGPPAASEDLPPVAEPDWLDLREPADRRARSAELARGLAAALRPGPVRILDVGCGSGATTRWLAPLLPGPQEWVLLDRDPALLALVPDRTSAARDRDGAAVARTTRLAEITTLTAHDLAAMSAVTASALVDVLTAAEIDGLAATCAAAGVPALLTLTVTGRVELDPPDPVDAEVAAAFDAHQRRTVAGRSLLGPDAAAVAEDAFRGHGMAVRTAETPWRLGEDDRALITRWLTERVTAAVEHQPDLRERAEEALRRRLNCAPLRAVNYHIDLLAIPNGGPR